MDKKFYMPISSKSLAHYFGSACIMPSRYFSNKPIDLQNKFEEYLLLATHKGTKDTDCCLELVLTDAEIKNIVEINKGFLLYQKPLPISRVKKVLFSNEDEKDQAIAAINLSTAFIPKNLIELIPQFDSVNTEGLVNYDNNNDKTIDWSNEVKRYNSFLGGFALMRLGGEDYMNYSENYFSTLSFFNEIFKNELLKSGRDIDERFFDAFVGHNSFKILHKYLNKNINENDLYAIAKEENQKIAKNNITRIIDLNKLEKATYIVAVLNTFGVGDESRKRKIDGLILSNFKSDIKEDRSEVIALCYGLNRGYSVFSNKYEFGNINKVVKFKLNSKVDYYTIESIFQSVFNNIKSENFTYLDNWCPKLKSSLSNKKTDYKVLDLLVIGKKKPRVSSQVYLANLLHSFFQKENEVLFKSLFEKIRTIVYNDTLDEINNEIELKDEEISDLKRRLEVHSDTKEEDISINTLIDKTPLNVDKEFLIKEVLSYNERNMTSLKKEAKEKGIDPKGKLKGDLIVLLLTSKSDPKLAL